MKKPLKVTITGAAGQIGYSLLFRVGAGDLLGKDQPIDLLLLERNNESSIKRAKGVCMELDDCAFPLLNSLTSTAVPEEAFEGADIAILVGSSPRGPGMTRADLLAVNAKTFIEQGKAMDKVASKDCKILVVGNPCNTNAYIVTRCAPSLNPKNITAMMRLDFNRSLAQLVKKTGCKVTDIEKLAVWGNHGNTMFPDLTFTTIDRKPALEQVGQEWYEKSFIPTVAGRGAAIIEARGHSSAASAANAAIDAVSDWVMGTGDTWQTMAVPSDGSYGIPEGLVFGVPVQCKHGEYKVITGLDLNDFEKQMIQKNIDALSVERAEVDKILDNM